MSFRLRVRVLMAISPWTAIGVPGINYPESE